MDKGGHYDVEIKEGMQKGGVDLVQIRSADKDGHYDMEIKGWIEKSGIMMYKLKALDGYGRVL